jgi:AcrR family transcriptional regulator
MYEESTLRRGAYHHGDLSETLIALALEALEREGAEGLSVATLAKRAGVSPMAPYRHFDDREALLAALARRGFEQLAAEMRRVAAPDPIERLTAFGVAYVEFAVARPGLFRLMFGAAPPTPGEGLSDDPTTVHAMFSACIAALAAPGEREDLFLAAWCLVHGLASLCVAGRIRGVAATPKQLAQRLAGLWANLLTRKRRTA